jgi:O-antigen ligase
VVVPISVPPVSTMLNQSLAAFGVLVWLLVWAVSAGHRGTARLGAPATALLLALVVLEVGQWWSAAPYGQRLLPAAALGVSAAAAWAGARGGIGTDRSFALPLLMALLVAALLSTVVAAVQVFAPQWADGRLVAFPTAPGRAVGNMRQPNQLSTLLVWGCAAAVAVAIVRRWSAVRLGAMLLALTLAVVLTASRTGMVGIAMLAAWGALDRRLPRHARWLMALTLPVYFAGWWGMEQWSAATGDFFYGDDQVKKTLHGDPSSSRGRIWANTLSLIAAHPWRGVGAGAFNFVWSMTPFPDRPVAFFDHSHNLPLQLAVESGLPFAALVLGLLCWAFWGARSALRQTDESAAITARSLAFMLAVVAVHSLLEYPLWYCYFLFPTALMAGCLCGTAAPNKPAARRAGFSVHLRWVSAVCVVGLVGLVWVGRQYYQVAVIFDPSLSIGEPATLEERIRIGQRSVLFGHHADYAKVTMAERPEEVADAFGRTVYHLLDTRLMIAYAKALAARGQEIEARHVAARLREFRNPAAEAFFAPCQAPTQGEVLPFQCSSDPRLSADALRPEQVFGMPRPR